MARLPRPVRGLRSTAAWALIALPLAGCAHDGEAPAIVGEPCIPADEAYPQFSGFTLGEVNLETRGSCGADAACLVHRFQGRATCPEGQSAGGGNCVTPDGMPIVVPVERQLESRPPELAVVCSCRCDGPDPRAEYCACPSDMRCEPLIASRPLSYEPDEYGGSYCVYPSAEPRPELVEPSQLL